MSRKSALLSGLVALLLVLVMGSPPVTDQLTDSGGGGTLTRASLTTLRWDPDMPSELLGPTILRLVVFILVAAVLGGVAGRARPGAAFVGGWGVAYAATAISGVAFALAADEQYSRLPGADLIDEITSSAVSSTGLAFWLGWLIGLAVLIGSFGPTQPRIPPAGSTGPLAAAPPGTWTPAPSGPPQAAPAAPTPAHPAPEPAAAPAPAPAATPAAPDPAPSAGPVIGAPPQRPDRG